MSKRSESLKLIGDVVRGAVGDVEDALDELRLIVGMNAETPTRRRADRAARLFTEGISHAQARCLSAIGAEFRKWGAADRDKQLFYIVESEDMTGEGRAWVQDLAEHIRLKAERERAR